MSFRAGEEVWLVERSGEPRRVTVDSVGRKYAYVRRYNYDEQFALDTGRSTENPAKFIETDSMRDARLDRHATTQRMAEVGLRFDWATLTKLSTDQLKRLIAILEEDNA